MSGLLKKVRSSRYIRRAWRIVHASGSVSDSSEVRRAIHQFEENAETNLNRLSRQLQQGKFAFGPVKGVLKRRTGKTPRPIAIASVEDRVVQRSILDVLADRPAVRDFISVSTSFGGLKDRGVSGAIAAVLNRIQEGADFYIRSDIHDFFRNIPRLYVIDKIRSVIYDDPFCDLLATATQCELDNLQRLTPAERGLFPTPELGIAQGCCLSPLLGNVLLSSFDTEMNGRGVHCYRYVDDFIFIGFGKARVVKAFERGQRILGIHGLTAYDPRVDPSKAQMGIPRKGIEFLGCSITEGRVSPNRKSSTRLLKKVTDILATNQRQWNLTGGATRADYDYSLVESLRAVHNVIKGWGEQYSFCNNEALLKSLDAALDLKIAHHLGAYRRTKDSFQEEELAARRRRLLGVHLLIDSKKAPILPLSRLAPKVRL